MQGNQPMKYRLNDFGGALEQAIRSGVGPGFLGMVVVLSRVMYQGGRKKWRATIAEAILVALVTGTVGPLLAYAGLDRDLAYPLAVFVGYVGIDRIALAVTTKLGIK